MFDDLLLTPYTRNLLSSYIALDPFTAPSLVLSGEKGLGKRMTGEGVAKFLLNCTGELSIDRHPDFLRVEPKDGMISKNQADEVREFVNIRASMASRKVVLLDDADLLGNTAANSLLKVLEDEVKTCVFIFVVHERILPTILSRCMVIDFSAIESEIIKGFLMSDINEFALMASGGKIGLYYNFVLNKDFLGETKKIAEVVHSMENPREILSACHAIQEKDGQFLYDVFNLEERIGFFVFLQEIMRQHLLMLSGCQVSFPNSNLKQFYDFDTTIKIINGLGQAIKMSRKKGKFTKNDFFELLIKFMV